MGLGQGKEIQLKPETSRKENNIRGSLECAGSSG